ncbi:MAG: glycosyltransferase, partial [Candidatus Saccharimonadales bacterium]
ALWRPNVFSVLIALLSLYRAFNNIRIAEARMHEHYLHQVTRRTALTLIGLQAVLALIWVVWYNWHTTGHLSWAFLAGVQLAVAIVLLISTVRRMRRTAWPAKRAHFSDAELPTVTVAIPARNETEDLQACLQNLIASDYPKLEIIVLDDCSQNRRTPEIIRGFAHDGVRFIPGEEPKETWLPKNQAYARLADEASGQYVLFCGVDVRFSETALSQVIAAMLDRKKRMMSILPERAVEVRSRASLAQAMRYFWELAPPRRLFRRPPVISSCWIIEKGALKDAGGFEAATRSIVPEAHFAGDLAKTDSYSFMRAGINPGITSMKAAAEQRDTAIRTRYPQLHRRPENVFMLALLELLFLAGPLALALSGYWFNAGWVAITLAAVAAALLTVTYEIVGHATKISSTALGLIALPLMAVYDLGMLHYSMWQYEFAEVDWKGRNICVPAMHVIPHLPKF